MRPPVSVRCERCSRQLLDGLEVPLPRLVLRGGKVQAERRKLERRHGSRSSIFAEKVWQPHTRARCDAYLSTVLHDCRGYVRPVPEVRS